MNQKYLKTAIKELKIGLICGALGVSSAGITAIKFLQKVKLSASTSADLYVIIFIVEGAIFLFGLILTILGIIGYVLHK